MGDDLRTRVRGAAGTAAPHPELPQVVRRARILRARRYAAGAIVAVVLGAAVAIPLSSLNGLRGPKPHRAATPGPVFGDGSVSFKPIEGWTDLQAGLLSACATTASFAQSDIEQSQNMGPNDALDCRNSAASLPPDGIVIGGSATDPYTWAQPSANFPASAVPPTLDTSTCGVATYEGQIPGTTECHVWITANDRQLGFYLWFGTETPSAALMATAQQGLDALTVSEPASLGNDIAFEPSHGWFDQAVTPSQGGEAYALPAAWTSNVLLKTFDGSYLPAGPSNNEIAKLPADGVIVSVEQPILTRNPLPDTPDFQPLPERPQLADAKLVTGGWEGLARSDVSRLYMRGVMNGRPVIIQATFGTADPSSDLIKQAQVALSRLVVVPTPPPTTALDDFGISLRAPDGWHGWLFSYSGDPMLIATTSEPSNPFYSGNVLKDMGSSDTTIILGESGSLQSLRWPAIDGPPQIGPDNLCVGCEVMDGGAPPDPGRALYHDTFTSGGRAFDLYVEFGTTPTIGQLADVNATLETLRTTANPSPAPAPPGGTAVGSLYDGAHPAVTANDADRTLSWSYAGGSSLQVPAGWTGWSYLVSDPSDPINLYAFGSWDVPQGGYCAPLMALQELPANGALVWIDRYGAHSQPESTPAPWPTAPQLGPGTDPAPEPTPCTAGALVQSFTWTLNGHTYGVHVTWGPNVTPEKIAAAAQALSSFTAG